MKQLLCNHAYHVHLAVLCVQVELPSGVGNGFQNKKTNATFTFNAEQIINSP